MLPRGRETLQEQAFGSERRHGKTEGAKRSDLRDETVEQCQDTREPMRLLVVGAELLLILLAAEVEDDRLLLRSGDYLLDRVTFLAPRHLRHLGNGGRDGMP